MKYGKVLISCRKKCFFFIADFHVLGLFIGKKHNLSEKNFSVCHAPLYAKICVTPTASTIRATAPKSFLTFVIWAGLMHLILRIFKFWNFFKKLRSQKIINRPSSVWVNTKELKLHIILQTQSFHKSAYSDFGNSKICLRKSSKTRNMRFQISKNSQLNDQYTNTHVVYCYCCWT